MRPGPGGHGRAPTWLRTTIRHVPMVSRTKPTKEAASNTSSEWCSSPFVKSPRFPLTPHMAPT